MHIPPIYGEDYEFQWGKIDYKNKLVLDIGGSDGDTADFFISKGARAVISIDNNYGYHQRCIQNAISFSLPIIPVFLDASCSNAISALIDLLKPDIVKSDCEGCEIVFATIGNDTIRKVKEYIIETHSIEIENALRTKFAECGYTVVDVNAWAGIVKIIYWKLLE